jgi:hypothetical protein
MTYFTVSNSRLPQPGEPGPRIYIRQEQGGLVIPRGTVFPFVASYYSQGYGGGIRHRLHAELTSPVCPGYIASARTVEKTPFTNVYLVLRVDSLLQKCIYRAVV